MIELPYFPDWSLWGAAVGFLLVLILLLFLITKRFSPTVFMLGIGGILLLLISYIDLTNRLHIIR
jgi:hypothetical protein